MGGHQSRTRKLTLDNEDPGSVIKVSDEVVERLKGSKAVRPVVSDVPPQGYQAPPGAHHMPFFFEPSLTSLQIRQANLDELKKNDQYWDRRMKQLQRDHEQIKDIMDCEYKKAIAEVHGSPKGAGDAKKMKGPPCSIKKAAVLECYKQHPNEPMLCAKEVSAFTECVDNCRAHFVESRS